MPFSHLSRLSQEQPLRVLLVNAGEADTLTWAGLVQPLRLAARSVGPQFQLDIRTCRSNCMAGSTCGASTRTTTVRSLGLRVLTNVKTRGTWGEVQLEMLL
eukprot:gene37176-45861_t